MFRVLEAPREDEVVTPIEELGRALQAAGAAVGSYAHIERTLAELRSVKVQADQRLADANKILVREGRTAVEPPALSVELGESTLRVHTDNLR